MTDDCLFCRIAAGEHPAEVVYEDDETVAFLDIHPAARGHILVIPRRHYRNLFDLSPEDGAAVMRTADANGLQDFHVVENGARFRSSRKVTQGAHKWIDVSVWKTPDTFAESVRRVGRRILVADMDGSVPIDDISLEVPTTLVFGNEAEGITDRMRQLADGAFRVPMYGFVESLNVSVAAARILPT